MTAERPDNLLVRPAPRLMEINWFWRRLWSFAVTLALLAIVALHAWFLGREGLNPEQAAAIQRTVWAELGLIAFVGAIYVGGATVYECWQLVSAVRVDRALLGRGDQA